MASSPKAAELPISEARERVSEVAQRANDGEIIYITRHVHRVAAVISAETATLIEELAKNDILWAFTTATEGMSAEQRSDLIRAASGDAVAVVLSERRRRDDYAKMVRELDRPEVAYVNSGSWRKLHRRHTRCAMGEVPSYEDYVHGGETLVGYDYQSAMASGLEFCKSCCRQEAGVA